ncbi:hypothetical protein NK8_82730 (plasmid) [Caballeronia sp. NK8]|uniref:hypothetical protein n=1 Tax=Caballeronia sp. NK8 TaxID=140098 RepID=UPI001BB546D5|nr:hypothetical protein [Caballeronia sp. NK8]BCQ28561.1 hypothetical protein NK8_67510 [Caballeronia sp. NK8]BCQ30082.1 hypothetical protein NK8_82730 [Caballeronia sp. NK8]
MKISIEQAKTIYREAIDRMASDGESASWWEEVTAAVEEVASARTERDAAAVIAWWHHDWSLVSDTPAAAVRRIRRAARTAR